MTLWALAGPEAAHFQKAYELGASVCLPRQMALEPDGRVLLVTDFSSQQLETVSVTSLP